MSFLFFGYNRSFKDIYWFNNPNPNFKFILFVYEIWKNCYSEGFCSCWKCLIMTMMMILINNFLEKENLDNNRGSLVVNDLQFYKKKTNLLRQRLLTNQCKPNSL